MFLVLLGDSVKFLNSIMQQNLPVTIKKSFICDRILLFYSINIHLFMALSYCKYSFFVIFYYLFIYLFCLRSLHKNSIRKKNIEKKITIDFQTLIVFITVFSETLMEKYFIFISFLSIFWNQN